MSEAFVYCWTDHKTGKLYIGSHKGSEDDGYVCSSTDMMKEYTIRPDDFSRQIIGHGTSAEVRVLETKILTAVNAASNDDFYNRSNGASKFYRGAETSDLTRQRLSKASKGRKLSDEARAKISATKRGKKMPEETRLKMIGRPLSEKAKRKLSETNTGRKHTDEVKARISASHFGKKLSDETKAKMSVSKTGTKMSPETRAKMSASHKAYHERKRQGL